MKVKRRGGGGGRGRGGGGGGGGRGLHRDDPVREAEGHQEAENREETCQYRNDQK